MNAATESSVPVAGCVAQAMIRRRYGGIGELELVDRSVPAPGPGEVLVAVAAAGVNPADLHVMGGRPYPIRLATGLRGPRQVTLGGDLAGRVVAAGPGVAMHPGERVFGVGRGSFATFAIASVAALAATPAGLSDVEAASLPIAGVAAVRAIEAAGAGPGRSVLVIGAAGGIGTIATQLAAAREARVTGVCSTSKMEFVRSLGAGTVIDYTATPDAAEWVAHHGPWDAVIDMIGTVPVGELAGMLTRRGVHVAVGSPIRNPWLDPFRRLLGGSLRCVGRPQQFVALMSKETTADLTGLAELVGAGALRPVIERSFRLDEVPQALEQLAAGHVRGKLVIDVAGSGPPTATSVTKGV